MLLFSDRKGGKQKRAPCCRSPNGKQKECEGRYALGPGREKAILMSAYIPGCLVAEIPWVGAFCVAGAAGNFESC